MWRRAVTIPNNTILHALAPTYLIELVEARKLDKRLRHADIPFLHQPVAIGRMWENRHLARRHHFYGIICLLSSGPRLLCLFLKQLWKPTFFKLYFEGQWSGSIRLCWTVLCTNVFCCTARSSTWWETALPKRLFIIIIINNNNKVTSELSEKTRIGYNALVILEVTKSLIRHANKTKITWRCAVFNRKLNPYLVLYQRWNLDKLWINRNLRVYVSVRVCARI